MMVTFWLIPAAVLWMMRGRPETQPDDDRDGAIRILQERLARGEIDAEEFETRRMLIESGAK
jgi:uncharacterized membrane protein